MEELLKDKCLDEIRWDAPSPLWLIVVNCNVFFFLNDRQTCTSPFLKTGAISPCTSPADVTLDATLFHSPPPPPSAPPRPGDCVTFCRIVAGIVLTQRETVSFLLKCQNMSTKWFHWQKSCTSTQLYLTGSGSGTLRHRRLRCSFSRAAY